MRFAPALACALVITGCGQKSDGGGEGGRDAIDAPFMNSGDLAVEGTSLRRLDSAEMLAELQSENAFYATPPRDTADQTSSPTEGACVASQLGGIRLTLVGQVLKGGGEFDLSNCFATSPITAFFRDVTIRINGKFYLEFGCPGVDLAAYDGKSLADLSPESSVLANVACSEPSMLSNGSFDVYFAGTAILGGNNQRVEQNDVSDHFTGRSDARPCTRSLADGIYAHADGCLDIDKTLNKLSRLDGQVNADEGTIDLVRLESEGLTEEQAGEPPFFASGRYLVQINDWTGELGYTSSNEAPAWAMSNGQESLTGSFDGGAPPGSSLVERMRLPMPRLRLPRLR
jgi:hypothetical protein